MAFKPGQSGNMKGRPKSCPEIVKATAQTKADLERYLNWFFAMTEDELKAKLADPNVSRLELAIAHIVNKASEGDHQKLDFLLNRLVGKVKEQIETTTITHNYGEDLKTIPRQALVEFVRSKVTA